MITLVKVNVLTDDEGLPIEFKERLMTLLQGFVADDPEGPEHARIAVEWKHAIHNREYMQTLPTKMGAEVVKAAPVVKKAKAAARR